MRFSIIFFTLTFTTSDVSKLRAIFINCSFWVMMQFEICRGGLYIAALSFLFVGIAIASDIFMSSIEMITSKKRIVKFYDAEAQVMQRRDVLIWNETVANLTLMALGSFISFKTWLNTLTRRERLKSAPYLRLKKRKTIFWKKTWNFWKKFFFQKKSYSAKKCKKGTLLDLLTYIPLQNIKNLDGGTLWGHWKIFEKKVAQCRKKSKGGPFGHVRFCGFPWKSK